MRSGWVNLYYNALRYTGFRACDWSKLAGQDMMFAYFVGTYNQDVLPFDQADRYNAFPVYSMCGAGM